MKTIIFLILIFICFSCKNNEEDASKRIPTTEVQKTLDSNEEISMDDIIYSGVWTIKSTTVNTKVILNQSNTDVTGSLEYIVLDTNGKLQSSTGVLSLVGSVEKDVFKADIYDPKGVKASAATITVKGKELQFKLTGAHANIPNSFTAYKL